MAPAIFLFLFDPAFFVGKKTVLRYNESSSYLQEVKRDNGKTDDR